MRRRGVANGHLAARRHRLPGRVPCRHRAAHAGGRRQRSPAGPALGRHPGPAHRPVLERPQAPPLHERDPQLRRRPVRGPRQPAQPQRRVRPRPDPVPDRRHDPAGRDEREPRVRRGRAQPLPRPADDELPPVVDARDPARSARSGSASSTRTRAGSRYRAPLAPRATGNRPAARAPRPARAVASRSAGATVIRGTSRTSGSTSRGCRPGRTPCGRRSTCSAISSNRPRPTTAPTSDCRSAAPPCGS